MRQLVRNVVGISVVILAPLWAPFVGALAGLAVGFLFWYYGLRLAYEIYRRNNLDADATV